MSIANCVHASQCSALQADLHLKLEQEEGFVKERVGYSRWFVLGILETLSEANLHQMLEQEIQGVSKKTSFVIPAPLRFFRDTL